MIESTARIKYQTYFSYYKKIFVFFRNRKTQKFNQALSFDSHGSFRTDDTWLHEYEFVKSLHTLLEDKLYTHQQKKIIEQINKGKVSESEFSKINEELLEFYKSFSNSFKNVFGYVSKNRFLEFISRL